MPLHQCFLWLSLYPAPQGTPRLRWAKTSSAHVLMGWVPCRLLQTRCFEKSQEIGSSEERASDFAKGSGGKRKRHR